MAIGLDAFEVVLVETRGQAPCVVRSSKAHGHSLERWAGASGYLH